MLDITYKQYLIGNPKCAVQGMKEFPVSEEVRIYAGEGLRVVKGVTKGGVPYWLLGEAYCANVYPREAVEDLNSDTNGDIFVITRYWTGRWVLIFGNELITDACGLMSAFYHKGNEGWVISSSLALMSKQHGQTITKKVAISGLTWQLLPASIIDSVKTLFCTQRMTLNQELEITFFNRFEEWKGLTSEQRVSTITNSLKTSLKNIEKFSNCKIWVALTAGKDSRLTFAAALASGVHFETYTASHRNLSDADRHLPEKISKKYGVTHHMLKPEPFSKSRCDDYCAFTGYNSSGADAEFYASGQFDQIPIDAISIKSGLFEAGQTYARSISGGEEETFISGIRNYYKTSFKDEGQVVAFNEWLDYQRNNSMLGIDIRDRFYLEQRLNGWASSIEQSLSINPFVTIQIANSAVVLGCLLYASSEDRECLRLSYDLIRNLDEGLLKYPVNQRTIGDEVRIILKGLKKRLHL